MALCRENEVEDVNPVIQKSWNEREENFRPDLEEGTRWWMGWRMVRERGR